MYKIYTLNWYRFDGKKIYLFYNTFLSMWRTIKSGVQCTLCYVHVHNVCIYFILYILQEISRQGKVDNDKMKVPIAFLFLSSFFFCFFAIFFSTYILFFFYQFQYFVFRSMNIFF